MTIVTHLAAAIVGGVLGILTAGLLRVFAEADKLSQEINDDM